MSSIHIILEGFNHLSQVKLLKITASNSYSMEGSVDLYCEPQLAGLGTDELLMLD